MQTAAATNSAPITLWDIARDTLTMMTLAIGGAAAIASIAKLTRKTRREIFDWLAPLEVLVRKLLLIEASKLPRPAKGKFVRSLKAHVAALLKRRAKPKKIYVVDRERPHTWRVSFRVPIPPDPFTNKVERDFWQPMVRDIGPPMLIPQLYRDLAARRALEAKKQRAETRRINVVRRIADRIEAIRRVLADPTPHAERLARKLYAKRPGRALRLAKAPPPRRHQVFVDPIRIATREAIEAAPIFDRDSS